MTSQRTVFLDPTGSAPEWLYVIVRAETGVEYQIQCGGTATWQRRAEGYLVPLDPGGGLSCLRRVFETDLRGSGLWGSDESERELTAAKIEECLTEVTYWRVEQERDEATHPTLDRTRLNDLDEAWIPVLTADGPGVLVWLNSD